MVKPAENDIAKDRRWIAFVKLLREKTGVQVRPSVLKRILARIVRDEAKREIIEAGGDPLYESAFRDSA